MARTACCRQHSIRMVCRVYRFSGWHFFQNSAILNSTLLMQCRADNHQSIHFPSSNRLLHLRSRLCLWYGDSEPVALHLLNNLLLAVLYACLHHCRNCCRFPFPRRSLHSHLGRLHHAWVYKRGSSPGAGSG